MSKNTQRFLECGGIIILAAAIVWLTSAAAGNPNISSFPNVNVAGNLYSSNVVATASVTQSGIPVATYTASQFMNIPVWVNGLGRLSYAPGIYEVGGTNLVLTGPITIYTTNTLSSDGGSPSQPLWNGVPLSGGGGSSYWITNSLMPTTISPSSTNYTVQLDDINGGLYIGNANAISNNWTGGTPKRSDVFIAQFNGDYGGNPSSATFHIEQGMNAAETGYATFDATVSTNNATLSITQQDGGPFKQILLTVDPSGPLLNLAPTGIISTDNLTNKWNFGGQTIISLVTNLVVTVNGVKYAIAAVPIP